MFKISFLESPPNIVRPDKNTLTGLLQLGSYKERFISNLVNWSRLQYVTEWRSALGRVLNGQPAALVTDMWLPTQNSHLVWWPMWLVDSNIVFHNQLLFFNQHDIRGEVHLGALFDLIGSRVAQDDEGNPLSEWSVPTTDIKEFLEVYT
jgi:hypothetical protein